MPPHVKRPLTGRRRGRVVENDEYAAFLARALRAYAARVGKGDIDAIAGMAAIAAEADTAMRTAVAGLRTAGYSWADIGDRLGITRQAAQQRWRDKTTTRPPGGESAPGTEQEGALS